jgi:hypothetical protein
MAAPGGKYFIQDQIKAVAAHHESYKQLWETKWKKPVRAFVHLQDLEHISTWHPSPAPAIIHGTTICQVSIRLITRGSIRLGSPTVYFPFEYRR